MTNNSPKGIFLDRDGTLIRDKNYLSRSEDIEYFPDTFEALRMMSDKGYRLYMITNQSGVGRGFFPAEAVHKVHAAIVQDLLTQHLPQWAGVGVCFHAPHVACPCRKPAPKMVLDLIERDQLNPALCWMAGDKTIDAECGKNAGIKGVVVREKSQEGGYPFFKTLLEFATQLP